MRFKVLALDYDGTVSTNGELDPCVRAALPEVRTRGVSVVIVTGRILDDLERLVGDLGVADAVVAENGGVLYFPASGRTFVLAPPVSDGLLGELRSRGMAPRAGRCVIDVDAAHADEVLRVVRERELPLVLLFNRSRLMVLPQGTSKATGLREALRTLRLSEHNAVGIGDAENDHSLLASCEVGVAVEWGSAELKRAADDVLAGDGPSAVAGYVRRLAAQPRLPPEQTGRRRLLLGHDADGAELWLAVRGRNVLIVGDPRSGKSFVAGLLAEQLILHHYAVCVVDPEGDFGPLASLPGVVTAGHGQLPSAGEIERLLRHADVSLVLDLSWVSLDRKREYVAMVLPVLAEMRRRHGIPHRVVVDEAHYFLHWPGVRSLLDLDLGGYTLITYRASEIHSDFLAAAPVVIATHTTRGEDVALLRRLSRNAGTDAEWAELHALSAGQAVLLPTAEEADGRPRRFATAPRVTDHVHHREKYVDMAVSDPRAFVFTAGGWPTGLRARTLREFADTVATVPAPVFDGHMRRGDFSRWIEDVFGNQPLSLRLVDLERTYRAARHEDARHEVVRAVRESYALVDAGP